MRREAVRSHEPTAARGEDVGDLDDIALDPPGDGDDLAHPSNPVPLKGDVDDDVDGAGHRRDDEAAADVTAVLKDGRRVHVFVEHAIGSLQRPMSDADLGAKFHALADPVLGPTRSASLLEQAWAVASLSDLRGLAAAARP